jgi:hypothetical protein
MASATQSPGRGELLCRASSPCWIPSSTWLLRSDVLSGIPAAGLQLQLRVPNWLGSASAGVAVRTVAASAIVAPNNNFSMIKDAPLGSIPQYADLFRLPHVGGRMRRC